jgi:hypothetical protein
MARRRAEAKKPPTKAILVKALADKWTFADLIDFHGGSNAFGECHRDLVTWQDADNREHRRQMVLMPRGHLKTTVATVLDILHSLYINPNLRIFVGSATQPLAKAILREIMSYFTDKWLQENVWNNRPHIPGRLVPVLDAYGRIQRRAQKTAEGGDFEVEDFEQDKKVIWRQDLGIQLIRSDKLKEPTVVIGSTESPATGFHYDRLYLDDILNFDNYDKPDKVERVDTWLYDMFNVLDDAYYDEDLYRTLCSVTRSESYRQEFVRHCHVGGDITVIGTRYFKHDWYGRLLEKELEGVEAGDFTTYVRNIYKNGDDNSDGYLWNERWTPDIETQRRRNTSAKNFYSQYLNKIVVDGTQVIPWSKVNTMNPAGLIRKENNLRILYEVKNERLELTPTMVVDPAATHGERSDYTVMTVGAKDKNNFLYILDIWCGKEPSTKWLNRMFDMCRKWNIHRVHLETVGFATELKTTARLLMPQDYPIAFADYKPKSGNGKKDRIENGLQPMFDTGRVFAMPWLSKLTYLTEQFDFFPAETVKDDAPDTFQMLNEVCKAPKHRLSNDSPTNTRYNTRFGGLY